MLLMPLTFQIAWVNVRTPSVLLIVLAYKLHSFESGVVMGISFVVFANANFVSSMCLLWNFLFFVCVVLMSCSGETPSFWFGCCVFLSLSSLCASASVIFCGFRNESLFVVSGGLAWIGPFLSIGPCLLCHCSA